MLKRPSARRRSQSEQITLNLVPIIDTMVTLIGFMLFTTSFLAIVSIETPAPQVSADQKPPIEKPLQLTVSVREQDTEVWSPFDKIAAVKIPNVSPNQPDVKKIHEALLSVKQKFPAETKVVIAPTGTVTYDSLVAVMDGMRGIDATDPPIFAHNLKTGNDEPIKVLFPDVIFGNLLGGT